MIDRQARNQMAGAIRSYLNEQIRAFEFSDALAEAAHRTEDRTVKLIHDALWLFYDDVKNHKVVATKSKWDCIYRFLLILESDAKIEMVRTRRRSPRRIVAACALAVFVVLALNVGSGLQFLVLYVTLGIVSLLLSVWEAKAAPGPSSLDSALMPFSSISELLNVRRRVPKFIKMPYPRRLTKRRLRPILEAIDIPMPMTTCLVRTAMRLLFSPLYLLFQCRPETNVRTTVKMAR